MKGLIRNILLKTGIYFNYLLLREKYLPSTVQKQEESLVRARAKFYSQFISPGALCFDVGANMGNRVAAFVSLGARVIAIEPQKYCTDYLRKKFRKDVVVLNMGLDISEEEKEFYISNHHAASSFSKDWLTDILPARWDDIKISGIVKMRTTTLDKLISTYGIPDFCKIDVEGYELQVLKGLTRPVKVISFEFTFPELKGGAISCLDHLQSISNIKCNYAAGEDLDLALKTWMGHGEFKALLCSKDFAVGQGDIYVSFEG